MRQKITQPIFNTQLNPPVDGRGDIKVFVFQPDGHFLSSSFTERLHLLETRILLAKKSLEEEGNLENTIPGDKIKKSKRSWSIFSKKQNQSKEKNKSANTLIEKPPKAIFVAPEYLFKDESQFSFKKYYTQGQKNEFKTKLQELSLDTDMLIVPGTICWYKKAKSESNNYFRNTAYFFYHGQVEKYKKRYPHGMFDFDYTDEGFLDLLDFRRSYFKSGYQDNPVKDFSGMKIGVEICYDSVQSSLSQHVFATKEVIHVQLIIADGANEAVHVTTPGTLLIKVEKNPSLTEIGTIQCTDSDDVNKLQPAFSLGDAGVKDLTCFKFNK
ncbi:Uncharacterised protein [Legionella wadsworthii]|uniref:Carbon-nitrogen hydrolase n=1 Tax=Legionella wadsworthii TaxID=28088 RepID=A0A378LTE9_9GAMM|nr:hypothetical protein [Legionella wadsworthii]STY30021.1 Uncharacterised protein [Legionella wadsworthii]